METIVQGQKPRDRLGPTALAIAVLTFGGIGCGDGGRHRSQLPAATPTATATPTNEGEHVELHPASTAPNGGALTASLEFDGPIPLFFAACLGGTGETCTGGTAVYIAANPGIDSIEESDAAHSLFTLHDGTPITLTVTAIDSPLVVRFESGTVRAVGDSVSLGEVPFHADAETQLALPGNHPSGQFNLSFKLSTPSGAYADSPNLTVTFVPRK